MATIFQMTFTNTFILNKNVTISIKISLKFVPKGPIINNPALIQMMAWRRPGDKPLSEPMMVRLMTHICVTRPQWVNKSIQGNDVAGQMIALLVGHYYGQQCQDKYEVFWLTTDYHPALYPSA